MTLSELLTEIKLVKPFAEEDVETGPVETLNARRGRKMQAIEKLVQLRRAYTQELRETAAFIVVVGSQRDEFTKLGVENFKCFSTDPETYFTNLVNRVPRTLYLGKESVANVFDTLGRHIEEMAADLGIVGYSQLLFRQEYSRAIQDEKDFLQLVKHAVTDQIGAEIVGVQAAQSLTKEAIERGNTAKVTPILLSTADEGLAARMIKDFYRISTRVFFVKAGETVRTGTYDFTLPEVTKAEVKKTLSTIGNSLRK